jgi:hypothetical protein
LLRYHANTQTRQGIYCASIHTLDLHGTAPLWPSGGWPVLFGTFVNLGQIWSCGVSGSLQAVDEADEDEWGMCTPRGRLVLEHSRTLEVTAELGVREGMVPLCLPQLFAEQRDVAIFVTHAVVPIPPERAAAWAAALDTRSVDTLPAPLRELDALHIDGSHDVATWANILAVAEYSGTHLSFRDRQVSAQDVEMIACAAGDRVQNFDIQVTLPGLRGVLAAPWGSFPALSCLAIVVDCREGETLGDVEGGLKAARGHLGGEGQRETDTHTDGEHDNDHDPENNNSNDSNNDGGGDGDDDGDGHGDYDDGLPDLAMRLRLHDTDPAAPETWAARLPPPGDMARALAAISPENVSFDIIVGRVGEWSNFQNDRVRDAGWAYTAAVQACR